MAEVTYERIKEMLDRLSKDKDVERGGFLLTEEDVGFITNNEANDIKLNITKVIKEETK